MKYLETFKKHEIKLTCLSKIFKKFTFHGSTKPVEFFYNFLFDNEGNKTQRSIALEENGITLSN